MGIYIGGDIIKRDIDISNNMTETRSIHQGPILKDKIGAGGMAEVFNCSINREPEGKWVIKQSIYPYVTELQKKFLFEIACATKIAETAPWIVPEINTTHSNETQLCMEKLHNITLRDFINYHYGYLSLKNTIDIAIQICEALALMQCSGGIVHRDLKLDNIMVIEDHPRIIIKIIDFGLACDAKNQMLAHGPIGSPSYAPPEAQNGRVKHDSRFDQYSLGIIITEIFNKSKLFHNDTKKIGNHESNLINKLPKKLKEIVLKLLQEDKNNRYETISELGRALAEIAVDLNPSIRNIHPYNVFLNIPTVDIIEEEPPPTVETPKVNKNPLSTLVSQFNNIIKNIFT